MPRAPDASLGYTLLELLVVIAIMALIAVMATPFAATTIESAQFRADTRRLTGELLHLQRSARDRQVTVILAPASGDPTHTIASSDTLPIPQSGKLSFEAETERLSYFSDGTTSGGILTFTEYGRVVRIEIAWLTGAITVEDGDTDAR